MNKSRLSALLATTLLVVGGPVLAAVDNHAPVNRFLQFLVQPQNIYTSAPAPLSDVRVLVRDGQGHTVPSWPVTLQVCANSQGIFLQGQTTVSTASNGVADFRDLDVSGSNIEGPYNLTASAPSARTAESNTFIGWDPTP